MSQPRVVPIGAASLADPKGGGLSRWRVLRLAGVAVGVCQLFGLLAWSYHLWSRFALSSDFALYDQAWQRIAAGHLSPYSTVYPYNYPHYGYPFIANHFELAMWPLALLHLVSPSSFTLLVVQDLALAGVVFVTYSWCVDMLARRWASPSWPQACIALVVLAALVANPFIYETASFDFHLQALATLSLVLAARDLWNGRHRRGVLFATATLSFGVPVSLYVVGVGVAVATMKNHRRTGLLVAGIGLVWLGVIGSLHMDIGSHLGSHYGYLIGRPGAHNLSALALGVGLLHHPGPALHVLAARLHQIYSFVASGGAFGLASPWGAAMAATVLVPNALNSNPAFISDTAAFQSLAAVPFVAVGSVAVGLWLSRSRLGRPLSILVTALACAQVGLVAVSILPGLRAQWPVMGADDARALGGAKAHIPVSAEVIASLQVIGRFAARHYVYPVVYVTQQFPVHSRDVFFVFYDEPARARYVSQVLHARLVLRARHVAVFEWHPSQGMKTVTVSPDTKSG